MRYLPSVIFSATSAPLSQPTHPKTSSIWVIRLIFVTIFRFVDRRGAGRAWVYSTAKMNCGFSSVGFMALFPWI